MKLKRGSKLLTVLLAAALPGLAWATSNAPENGNQNPAPATANAAAPSVPDDYKLELLIRTTIIAVNQANATGNYSVLRDLAAPGFQDANNAARLAEIFAGLRGRKLDLSPILVFPPKLVQPPMIQPDGRLRLTGFFDTKPERVIFDMMFEMRNGDWRLFGIALEVAPPGAAGAADAAPPPPGNKVDGGTAKTPGKDEAKTSDTDKE